MCVILTLFCLLYNITLFLYGIHMHYKDIFLLCFDMKFIKILVLSEIFHETFGCTRTAAGSRGFSIHTVLAWPNREKPFAYFMGEAPQSCLQHFSPPPISVSSANFQRPRICIEC